jgi:hypothetical protein
VAELDFTLVIVIVAVAAGVAWMVITARKSAQGMGRLAQRLDHSKKKK